MRSATADPVPPTAAGRLGRGFDPTALGALFVLSLRQHLRGRRLLVLSLLFLLPAVLAAVLRLVPQPSAPAGLEFALVYNLVPHALATLAALLYAAGLIQDEVEDQTLTYLLLRPLPRWALYVTRLAASLLVTAALTAVFTTLTLAVIWWDTPELWGGVLPGRALKVAALLALAQAGYCSLFGAVGLLTRRALVAGLAYIVVFEGLLASFETLARRMTVMYYFRVLVVRWLDPSGASSWSIDLTLAPGAGECVRVLLLTAAAFTVLGAVLTARREFRMKTPEGS
jgi:ABC-2 type transport system permease protein